MKIAVGQLWQETNTFNPLPTTRADFEAFGVLRGAEHVPANSLVAGLRDLFDGWKPVPEAKPAA